MGFQVIPDVSITRSSGAPGASVTLEGVGFGSNEQDIEVTFDGSTVLSGISADASGAFEASFLVPSAASGQHKIEVSGPLSALSSSPRESFDVTPTVTLSESEGNVGMNVAVSGRGFSPESNITLTYDDVTQATVISNDAGSFNLQFEVPKSIQGDHTIKVLDENSNRLQQTFAIEGSPPETPNLRSPANGERGAIFGGFKPVIRWTPVEDPSGVIYNLEVATDPDFIDIILEERGLTTPTYRFSEADALARGKYYWRVQAVDGASNEGAYTSHFVMNSGLIPFWIVPAGIILGLLASGGGAYAYYSRVYRPRKQAEEAVMFPEFVRISRPQISGPAQGSTPESSTPAIAAPRRALPSPFRREAVEGGRHPRNRHRSKW